MIFLAITATRNRFPEYYLSTNPRSEFCPATELTEATVFSTESRSPAVRVCICFLEKQGSAVSSPFILCGIFSFLDSKSYEIRLQGQLCTVLGGLDLLRYEMLNAIYPCHVGFYTYKLREKFFFVCKV